ncbi:MAG: ABC transporter ATP-binding protein [candidate division NC10 bacterium]|nr:ABC transporter ATP-binding protein [candidate division NC10 bacterium]
MAGLTAGGSLLEARGLYARYGLSRVLFDVNLHVRPGEAVGLLGRNGAGKSTTLKAITGLVSPAAGEVIFAGGAIHGRPPHEIARKGIGYVPQERRIFPELSVWENLEVGRRPCPPGRVAWDVRRIVALFPALESLLHRTGGSLSGGEQQMLAIARTLFGNPRLLLLDEPSEGLAPVVVRALAEQILRLKRDGMTLLLSEQNLHFTTQVCDRVYILERGHIQYEGGMADLLAGSAVRRRYLMV